MKPAPEREEALFQAAVQLTGAERAAFLTLVDLQRGRRKMFRAGRRLFGWETIGGKPLRDDIKKAPSLRSSYQKVGGHRRTWKEIRVRLIVPIVKSRIY